MIGNYLKLLSICFALFLTAESAGAQQQKVWIDADTGNETDDIYALARLLKESSVDVVGVSSAHFNNPDLVVFEKWNQYNSKDIKTVEISQQLNEALLAVMGRLSVSHPLGADRQTGRAWGGREPRNSPAAQGIIEAAKKLKTNEKLVVISLGAMTNIASAIMLDSSICSHIICYALGARYNVVKSTWNKNEFNIRNDLNAFDYLLDNPTVDITMMPIEAALPYRFFRDSLYKILREEVPLENMLKKRWQETNPQDAVRTLWDLALVEAVLRPEYAVIKQVLTPSENMPRIIKIFSQINVQLMKDDFIKMLR